MTVTPVALYSVRSIKRSFLTSQSMNRLVCWSLRFSDNMNCCVFWQSKFLLGSKLVASGHVANPYTKIYVHLVPWVLVIGGGCKTVLSVCFKGAFLLMHNSRRKTGDNVFLLERIYVLI